MAVRIYTTCPGCGEYLLYLGPRNTTHALCEDTVQAAWDLERRFLDAATAGQEDEADRLAALLDGIDKRPPRLLDSALFYASWGWPVFPLKPGTKEPATRNGFKDATTSTGVIREWWRRNPSANIGVRTGVLFDALDVDFKNGAWRAWLEIRDSSETPTAHGISITPTSGLHVLFKASGYGSGANMFRTNSGLDYRGKGGYIVAPPSVLADGTRWAWRAKPSPMVKVATAAEAAA